LGINAVHIPHRVRYVAVWRFNKKVIVICHQAIAVNKDIVELTGFVKDIQEELPVTWGARNRLASVAAAHDMIYGTRVFQAKRTNHLGQSSNKLFACIGSGRKSR
jgi:hypothetical protein